MMKELFKSKLLFLVLVLVVFGLAIFAVNTLAITISSDLNFSGVRLNACTLVAYSGSNPYVCGPYAYLVAVSDGNIRLANPSALPASGYAVCCKKNE